MRTKDEAKRRPAAERRRGIAFRWRDHGVSGMMLMLRGIWVDSLMSESDKGVMTRCDGQPALCLLDDLPKATRDCGDGGGLGKRVVLPPCTRPPSRGSSWSGDQIASRGQALSITLIAHPHFRLPQIQPAQDLSSILTSTPTPRAQPILMSPNSPLQPPS